MENSEENELITDRIDSYELGQQEDWPDQDLEEVNFEECGWNTGLEKVMQAAHSHYKSKWGSLNTGQEASQEYMALREKILKNLSNYDPERASKSKYIYLLVESELKDLIEKHESKLNHAGIEKRAEKDFLTPEEVAEKLKLQLSTVRSWIRKNRLPITIKDGEELIKKRDFEEAAKDYAALNADKLTLQKEPIRTQNKAGEEYNQLDSMQVSNATGSYKQVGQRGQDKPGESPKSRPRSQVHNHGAVDYTNSWHTVTDIIDFKRLIKEMNETEEYELTKQEMDLLHLLDREAAQERIIFKMLVCNDFKGRTHCSPLEKLQHYRTLEGKKLLDGVGDCGKDYHCLRIKKNFKKMGEGISDNKSPSRKGKRVWNKLTDKIRGFLQEKRERCNLNKFKSYNINEEEEENNIFS